MARIFGSLTLRPTRIGFLVRPDDLPSVRRIVRLCACLWGGGYNPIIPVPERLPAEWIKAPWDAIEPKAMALGYVKFFEPDVFVEAIPGLASEIGIVEDELDQTGRVVTLAQFVAADELSRTPVRFGLDVFDLYRHVHETENQFVQRRPLKFAEFAEDNEVSPFAEAA